MLISDIVIFCVSLALGFFSGVIMHRSDFCLAGVFRDFFIFKKSPLFPSLVLLTALSMLLFEMARLSGFLSYDLPSSLFGLPALTTIAGGLLFGVGMVLAGGCVIGVLYKAGSGSLVSLVAIVGIVVGSAAYAEFHFIWFALAQTTRLSEAATLPQLLNLNQTGVFLFVGMILLTVVRHFNKSGKLHCSSVVRGYLQPQYAVMLLSVIGVLSFSLLGMPLGITTTYAKLGAYIEQLILPTNVAANEYFHNRAFIYYSPIAKTNFTAGAGPFLDGLSLVQIPLIGGVLIGSFVSSLLMKTFSMCSYPPPRQWISALIGGVLMGLASRMTPACNVWHLLGGVPLLSLQSLVFVIGLVPGAWLGTRLLMRCVIKT